MSKIEHIQKLINEVFTYFEETPYVEIEANEENAIEVRIEGQNLNFLIGYRGQSLDGLQNLLSIALRREFEDAPILLLDINGYKKRRAEKIQDIARKYIDKARFSQDNIEMPPMNPWERRQIHVLVAEYDDIESESVGEGRDRRVVLKLRE